MLFFFFAFFKKMEDEGLLHMVFISKYLEIVVILIFQCFVARQLQKKNQIFMTTQPPPKRRFGGYPSTGGGPETLRAEVDFPDVRKFKLQSKIIFFFIHSFDTPQLSWFIVHVA